MNFEDRTCIGCGKSYRTLLNSPQKYHSSQCSSRNRKKSKKKKSSGNPIEFTLILPDFSISFIETPKVKDRRTKPEKWLYEFLNINGFEEGKDFIFQYKIFNYFIDFYFPSLNLGIEVDGDYWHANPNRYKPNKIINYPTGKFTAKEIWERDQLRENIITSKIKLKRFWASDLLNEKCNPELFKLLS